MSVFFHIFGVIGMGLFLSRLNQNAYYWLFIVIVGFALEASALFYQYVLGDQPCVICIHIRIWVLGFIVVGLLGLLMYQSNIARIGANLLSVAASIGLAERTWELYATERGWVEGSCEISAGLPSWFELDSWFPAIFGVKGACGYTPYIIAKISMAEILMVIVVLTLIVTTLMTMVSIVSKKA